MDIKTTLRYKKIKQNAEKCIDALGHPIDKGILELVILLNYYKVGTTQSCWGHYNWGDPYPWIDISKNHLSIIYEIIQDSCIEVEDLDTDIRILPIEKNLKNGRKCFNKLKEKLKKLNGKMGTNS